MLSEDIFRLYRLGKSKLSNNMLAWALTIIVMVVLLLPVKAVIVDLATDKEIYKADDIVTFTASIDIENDERIPVKNLSLSITNSSDQGIKECSFSLYGTKISGCSNIINITPINVVGYGYGDMFGYGYGYGSASSYGYGNQSYDYGYGYGYTAGYSGLNGELAYNITWNISADNVADGNYSYDLLAYADDGAGNTRVYSDSSLSSFEYDATAPVMTVQQIVSTSDTTPLLNVTTSENANCSYRNSTSSFALMDTTGELSHTQALTLYTGDFSYVIRCVDEAGNTANESVTFTIISSDINTTDTYHDSIETVANESAEVNTTSDLNMTIVTSIGVNGSITVGQYDSDPQDVTTGFAAAALGKYFAITAADDIMDNLGWVYLKISYEDSDISSNNINESTLKIYYYNDTLGRWAVESDTGVNVSGNYVWANVSHLSIFGAGGDAVPSTPSRDTSRGGGSSSYWLREPEAEEEIPVSPLPVVPAEPTIPAGPTVPAEEPGLPEQLFDITFNLDDRTIASADKLSAYVTFESFGTVPTPVDLTFIIIDKDGNKVYRAEADITVATEEVLRWNYEDVYELPPGKYTAILHTLYNTDVTDEFRQDFEISPDSKSFTIPLIVHDWYLALMALMSVCIIFIAVKKRRKGI